MIWQVVDDDQLSSTAQQLALHFASQPTFGLGLIKQAINAAETNSLDAQLDRARLSTAGRSQRRLPRRCERLSGEARTEFYGEVRC